MLKINDLSKTFGQGTVNEHRALKKICLDVKQGEFISIIGSNGSGKSTLFNCIAGSLLPEEGKSGLQGGSLPQVFGMAEEKEAAVLHRESGPEVLRAPVVHDDDMREIFAETPDEGRKARHVRVAYGNGNRNALPQCSTMSARQ